ncbi:class I SAM-dependent methyltransferase [Crossiella cryophila]|uniref:O-methyltransferase involved in polyketide biosynthesis n=1 Tax=Crossiella cryophila TaxID=43355 RepID=A0A7W7FSL8_9PSEU|nr:class I SAM-dependent methyltransferase [Crossiella cryophila]MBB4675533.1 O-methyltransferase involved in polyketide biosynthesis [Crossiella cryophila]
MAQIQVQLGDVQETLLATLYARAVETGKKRGLLRDETAARMVARIDYDFTRFGRSPMLLGSVLRTLILDEWVREFIDAHPGGTVIEIGAGLNTRFERLDNGRVHWVDLDLPDAMALRRRFFTECDRRKLLGASVLAEDWPDAVRELPGPYFFVAEGVLLYFPPAQVRLALAGLSRHFPGAGLAFDTAGRWLVDNQDAPVFEKTVAASFRWGCDDPAEIAGWGLGLAHRESRTLLQLPKRLARSLPPQTRATLGVVRAALRSRARGYQVSLFDLEPHVPEPTSPGDRIT